MNKKPVLHVASNTRGFGILEVLIAAGVMSIISLVVASMISQQNSQVSQLEDRLARAALKNELITNFANVQRCGENLNGVQISRDGKSSFQLTDAAGHVIFNPEVTNNKYDTLRIRDVSVTPSPNNLTNPSSRGVAMINVELERTRGTEAMKPISVPVEVNINSNRQVTECISSAAEATPFCLDISGSVPDNGSGTIPSGTRMIMVKVDYMQYNKDTGNYELNEYEDIIYPGITKTETGKVISVGGTLKFEKVYLVPGKLYVRKVSYNGEPIVNLDVPTAMAPITGGLWVKRPFKYRSPATCETVDPNPDWRAIFYKGTGISEE